MKTQSFRSCMGLVVLRGVLWASCLPAAAQADRALLLRPAATSDPAAVTAVQRAITAMGGERWSAIGAGATQETRIFPQEGLKPLVSKRSDDWSRDGVVLRREPANPATGEAAPGPVTVASRSANLRKSASGKYSVQPRGYDLSSLALAYPAVALRLALQRKECSTKMLLSVEAGGAVIQQRCASMGVPGNSARLTWWLDANGLPTKFEYPAVSADGRGLLYETAVFRKLQQAQGMTVPAEVEIRLNEMLLYTLDFAAPALTGSLPESLFSLQSAQTH